MKDPSKKRITAKIEAYWWLPFAVLAVGVMFYSIFTAKPLSSNISTAMMVCGILAFIGWLTRKKSTKQKDYSNSMDNTENNCGNAVSLEDHAWKEDGKS